MLPLPVPVLVLAIIATTVATDQRFVVRTADGHVRGMYKGSARAFLGIPFAAPPVGSLRFALPRAPSRWNDTLNATHLSARCIQTTKKGNPEQEQSEDCLYLNVFTPRNSSTHLLPVMVYVHGGGMESGCSADFPGYNLADYADMVVVVIQYRVNVFGFYLHDEMLAGGTSNLGLHDQILALRWVQSNIRSFGGDPTAVLIAGQSSGCSSVGFHLVYPPSWSLYARAAMMSCAMNDWQSKSTLVATGTALARSLGCTKTNSSSSSVLSCMRALNTSSVSGAAFSNNFKKFQPCYNCLEIPSHPLALMRGGRVNRGVEVMLGNARYEHGTGRSLGVFGPRNSTHVTAQHYHAGVLKVAHGNTSLAAAAVAKYAPLAAEVGYWYALATMDAHSNVVCAQQYQSEWLAALGNLSLYRYVFSHATVDWPNRVLNATHTAALPYLFREPSVLEWFLGYKSFTPHEQDLADGIAMAWRNFARSGNPNAPLGLIQNPRTHQRQGQVDYWPKFEVRSNYTFVYDTVPKAIRDGTEWYSANELYCSFWASNFVGPFPP